MLQPRQLVKEMFYRLGFDIKRLHPQTNEDLQLQKAIDYFGIDLVLDVGANVGQFVQRIRKTGYRGRCVSFEPLAAAHGLLRQAACSDPLWHIHDRVALGSEDGTIEINIARNSASSSVLPMTAVHLDASPGSEYYDREVVALHRLDGIAGGYINGATNTLLKIDVQGYQGKVLEGAVGLLARMEAVLCELSLVPCYEGEILCDELIDRMKEFGFIVWALYPGFSDPHNGRTLQLDVFFVRR